MGVSTKNDNNGLYTHLAKTTAQSKRIKVVLTEDYKLVQL